MLKYIKKKDENEEHVVVVSYGLNCGSSEDLRKSWIVDSGATTHVCSDRSLFLSFEDLENSQAIMVGNGERVLAKRKRKVQLSAKVILQNVLFCPDLHVNLISVPKLIESGCTTYFENVEAAQALVPGRSNPLGTTTEFRSSTFEEYGAPVGPRRAMPIPAVFDTDEEGSRFTQRSSAVDEAAIEWGYSPLILACNTQLRRWQPTNVSNVNALLLTWYRSPFEAEENRKQLKPKQKQNAKKNKKENREKQK
eukprot:scaffold697_cov287-Pavlova_lutheri.AAC.1